MSRLTQHPIMVLIIGLLCLSPLLVYFWFEFSIVRPYNLFRVEEVKAIPAFDKLNENVANSLPPLPDDVSFVKKSHGGINTYIGLHGRYLYLSFKRSTPTPSDAIQVYYKTYLLDHGWSEVIFHVSSDSYLGRYYLNTSCLEIDTYSLNLTGEFEITIWHDFKSQSFSPAIPNDLFIGLFESGKTSFAECPWPSP